MRPDDILPRPPHVPPLPTQPHTPPLQLTSVWECDSPAQADAMLGKSIPGYVYQRDGHPNGDTLAELCRQLHGAEQAALANSGMAAISAVLLATLKAGDHVVVSRRIYGKTMVLFQQEGARLGIETTAVDTCDLNAVAAAMEKNTRLVVAETIANPLLEVADIRALGKIAHFHQALLLVDNTFATPIVCRPLALGADLVMESLTKMMNGHSDVILGAIAGTTAAMQRIPAVLSTWGLASHPFDCWLATRGLATLAVRMERACKNAQIAAEFLQQQSAVKNVFYPGLKSANDRDLAVRQFTRDQFGYMVTFELAGGRAAADAFIASAQQIPFCPSLGSIGTSLSHPETTSHRGLTEEERLALGITGGTIRLSVGIESPEFLQEALAAALQVL